MAQQAKLIRVKALKMFKASIDGALPIMVHPGDVVEVDRFMAGMLMTSEKAIATEEKLHLDRDYTAPVKPISIVADPFGAILKALETLTGTLGTLSTQKGR